MDSKKNPNPIYLVNRLKDFVKRNCSVIIDNFKCSESYNTLSYTERRRIILDLKRENTKITFRSNRMRLLDYSEEEFLKIISNLDDEKYNV